MLPSTTLSIPFYFEIYRLQRLGTCYAVYKTMMDIVLLTPSAECAKRTAKEINGKWGYVTIY